MEAYKQWSSATFMLKGMLNSILHEFSHLLLFLDYLLAMPLFQKDATITLEVMHTLQKFYSELSEFYNWKVPFFHLFYEINFRF